MRIHICAALLFSVASLYAGDVAVVGLRCDGREAPLGVDVPAPRLGWRLESAVRGAAQSAYRVLVASRAENLAADRGDLWDSGKVASSESVNVFYAGAKLAPAQQCFWKVRAWDAAGAESAWSAPSSWTMGLLAPENWRAKWITYETPGAVAFAGASWIWHPEGDALRGVPPGTCYFRRTFELPAGARVRAAELQVAADNSAVVFLNGVQTLAGAPWDAPARLDVAAALRPGPNNIWVAATNGGTSANPAGLILHLAVALEGAAAVTLVTDATWKSAIAPATAVASDQAPWRPAVVLGAYGVQPWAAVEFPRPMPIFRKDFSVAAPVARALVFVCGLGHYELTLNGQRVGSRVLDPLWTNYRTRCFYSVYDVAPLLRDGANALGLMLGNGMYNVPGGRYVKFQGSFGPPKAVLQLRIEYRDGSVQHVLTDNSWRATEGPIRFSCVYGGEDHDARCEQPGWNQPGFDARAWAAAAETEGPGGALIAQSAPAIEVTSVFAPRAVDEIAPHSFRFDLGQNGPMMPWIKVKGPRGSAVRLRVAELPDGGPDYHQAVWFTYTLEGEGEETWQPRFTYHGCRYITIDGVSRREADAGAMPVVLALEGRFVRAAARRVGEFSCANALFNGTYALIDWAVQGNFQSVLTDCPHREKLGWLEVSHLMGPAIMYTYDAAGFYAKVSADMQDAQLPNGLVPDIAPEYVVFQGGFRDSPEWGSAAVINPYFSYLFYADEQVLRDQYGVMAKYVAYLGSRAKGHILSHGLGDWYAPDSSTPLPLVATATYYWDVTMLARTARQLGKDAEAAKYDALAAEIRTAFNEKFYDAAAKKYGSGSQTSQAMPLVVGLAPESDRAGIVAALVARVKADGVRVTAGDVGHRFLLRALADAGRSDVICAIHGHDDAPGYGFQLKLGKTTLTEGWDGGSSQNHCMLGHLQEWFYHDLAGIRPDPAAPGFKAFAIKPAIVDGIPWAKATYDSVHGPIASAWRRDGDALTLEVTVPPNTTATVYVPAREGAEVTESGRPAKEAEGVTAVSREEGFAVCKVGAGKYVFRATPSGEGR